jgi:enoyl-CoA hydratase/carnithine racemase
MKIVDEVCDASNLMSLTFETARTVTSNAPLAVHGTRATIQSFESDHRLVNCSQHLEQLRKTAFQSRDLAESLAAFKERRSPIFKKRMIYRRQIPFLQYPVGYVTKQLY